MIISKKAYDWLKKHSAVEVVNVSAPKGQDYMIDLELQLEIQQFVQGVVSKAACELTMKEVRS